MGRSIIVLQKKYYENENLFPMWGNILLVVSRVQNYYVCIIVVISFPCRGSIIAATCNPEYYGCISVLRNQNSVTVSWKQNNITIVVLWKQNCISVVVLETQNSFTEAYVTSADIIDIKPNLGLALMRWNRLDWSSHESSQYCWQQSQYVRDVGFLDAIASLVSTLVTHSVTQFQSQLLHLPFFARLFRISLKCFFASNIWQTAWTNLEVFFRRWIILPDFMNIYLEEKLFRVCLCMFNVNRTFETAACSSTFNSNGCFSPCLTPS